MEKSKIISLAFDIKNIHEQLCQTSIVFESFGEEYRNQNFMVVHHSDGGWSIGFAPIKLFEEGELAIESDGRLELTITKDPVNAWKLAIDTLVERHALITKMFGEIDMKQKETEKQERIKELQNELERLQK